MVPYPQKDTVVWKTTPLDHRTGKTHVILCLAYAERTRSLVLPKFDTALHLAVPGSALSAEN